MDIQQSRKEVNYWLEKSITTDMIANLFFIYDSDDKLIKKINKNDESALLQFFIKHLPALRILIISKPKFSELEEEAMNIYLPFFIQYIKDLAKKHHNKLLLDDWMYDRDFRVNFKQAHFHLLEDSIDKKYEQWKKMLITPREILLLNKLNNILIKTEEDIVLKAKDDLMLLQQNVGLDNTIIDYEYFVDIAYYRKHDENPIYTTNHGFNIGNLLNDSWGLLCDGTDWLEGNWPTELEKPCCYLMHELLYHAKLAERIFSVSEIFIDYKSWEQSLLKFKNNNWKSMKNKQQ